MSDEVRLQNRVNRMAQRIVVLRQRLADDPNNPKAPMWQRRIEEFETSVKNIMEHGKEVVSNKPAGVKIEVPHGVFGFTAHQPEGK